jgi:hypothetical protein
MSTIKFQINHWLDLLTQLQKTSSETISAGKRYVFVYICANWSMPCRQMETETLGNQLVGDFFNANFLNVRVVMGVIPEADTKKKLKEILNVSVDTYPLCLFLNHEGKVIHQAVGDLSPNDLINEGKTALSSKINRLLETL